jgi:hypothetical protein
MNFWKILAVFFLLFSIGFIQEGARILTTSEADLGASRSSLIPFIFVLAAICLAGTVYCWKRGADRGKRL